MKTDARIRYTQMIIKQTFLSLVKTKPLSKITVKEICDVAEINRTTFYKHYHDVYDLLDKLETRAISDLLSMIEKSRKKEDGQVLLSILRTIYENHDLFANLIPISTNKGFAYRLSVSCFEKIKELSPNYNCTNHLDLTSGLNFSYLVGGISGVIEYWLQTGMKESPEVIADTIARLTSNLSREG